MRAKEKKEASVRWFWLENVVFLESFGALLFIFVSRFNDPFLK